MSDRQSFLCQYKISNSIDYINNIKDSLLLSYFEVLVHPSSTTHVAMQLRVLFFFNDQSLWQKFCWEDLKKYEDECFGRNTNMAISNLGLTYGFEGKKITIYYILGSYLKTLFCTDQYSCNSPKFWNFVVNFGKKWDVIFTGRGKIWCQEGYFL